MTEAAPAGSWRCCSALACGVFVAAEFSLTTVERSDLERAVERGERGADSALKAVRGLTFQLSGAQLGITVTGLVIGMLVRAVDRRPAGRARWRRSACPPARRPRCALVLGTVLSTVVLMVVGELVPKNWAISSRWPSPSRSPNRSAASAPLFRPLISASEHHREPHRPPLGPGAGRGAGLRPRPRRSWWRWPGTPRKEGALEPDTAELFVRTLHALRPDRGERHDAAGAGHRPARSRPPPRTSRTLTRATGLSRFPVYRGSLDEVVGIVHLKDVLAVPPSGAHPAPRLRLLREPLLVPETLPVDRLLDRLSGKQHHGRGHRRVRRHGRRGHAGGHRRGGRRRGPRRARPAGDRPTWRRPAADRTAAPRGTPTAAAAWTSSARSAWRLPDGPYETLAGLVAPNSAGSRPPATSSSSTAGGWMWLDATGRPRGACPAARAAARQWTRTMTRRSADDRAPAFRRAC